MRIVTIEAKSFYFLILCVLFHTLGTMAFAEEPIKDSQDQNDLSTKIVSIEEAAAALKEDSDNPSRYLDLGFAYHQEQKLGLAIDNYSKALNLDKNLSLGYSRRGLAFNQKRKYKKALDDFNKAVELDPKNADTFLNRAFAYSKLKNYRFAEKDLSKSIRINSTRFQPYIGRAYVNFHLKEFLKAAKDYKKALSINPDLIDAKNNLPLCYLNHGVQLAQAKNYIGSIASFKKAIALGIVGADVYNNIATSYSKISDYKNALHYAEKSIQLDKKPSDTYALAGHSAYRVSLVKKASKHYQEALKINPKRAYWALYRFFLFARHAGIKTSQDELKGRLKFLGTKSWPFTVFQLFVGKISPEDYLDLSNRSKPADPSGRLCEAHYYLGQWYLLIKKPNLAKRHFQLTVRQNRQDFVEHGDAEYELKRLKESSSTSVD